MKHFKSMVAAGMMALASVSASAAPGAAAAAPAAGAIAPATGDAVLSPPAIATTPAPAAATPQFFQPVEGIGQPDGRIHIQEQVTEIGRDAEWMHDIVLMPIITLISIFVLGLLMWVMWRYRASANPTPSRTSHNTVIEIVWTLVPVLILVVIAVPSIKLLAAQYAPPKADLTVKVVGHQWYWTYEYPDNGGLEIVSNILKDDEAKRRGEPRLLAVDERMVVPVGATVKLIVTSDDVIHAFAVPAFWAKMDAVPGRLNETWFKADKPGLYYGQCSELCGARHGYMPIAVEVVSQAQFAQWIAAKGGTIGAAPTSSDATAAQPASTPSGAATPAADVAAAGATPAPAENASGVAATTSQGATANQGPQ